MIFKGNKEKEMVYVQVTNTNEHPIKVKKGEVLAIIETQETIASITIHENPCHRPTRFAERDGETPSPSPETNKKKKPWMGEEGDRKLWATKDQMKNLVEKEPEHRDKPSRSPGKDERHPEKTREAGKRASWGVPDPRGTGDKSSNHREKEVVKGGISKVANQGRKGSENPTPEGRGKQGISEEEIGKMLEGAKVSEEEKEKFATLIRGYADRFSDGLAPAGMARYSAHRIKLKTNDPVFTTQYRNGKLQDDILDHETAKLVGMHVVRKSWSPYNSPILVVKKKDGSWRNVIDYRNLNKVTIKEPYPIPRAEEAFDALAKAKFMSTLDFTSGYWQIPIAEEDKEKTAFTTKSGRWEYNILPMGITNAAPTFQRNMEMMLSGLLWKICIIYIDDIIIFSSTVEEHHENLRIVLERMREFNIVAKPKKCELMREEVSYLGHRIGHGKLSPLKTNVDKIVDMPVPKTIKEVRSFVCLAGYYRRFVRNFAKIARPLTDLQKKEEFLRLKKIRPGEWALPKPARKAVQKLKRRISSNPVMALPNFDKPFEMKTDASNYAIGGVLYQKDGEGHEHPIWYASRVLSKEEMRYSTTEREMLGVYHWIRYWKAYLWGQRFVIYTDHSPLTGIRTSRDITGRLTRMILKLQEFDFELKYIPGKKNGVADALSRTLIVVKTMQGIIAGLERGEEMEREGIEISNMEWGNTLLAFANKEVEKENSNKNLRQREREKAKRHVQGLTKRTSTRRMESTILGKEQQEDDTLEECRRNAAEREKGWVILEEVLYRYKKRSGKRTKKDLQLVLPKKYREEIMEAHHDEPIAGYLEQFKTIERIAKNYWWPNMAEEIRNWVRECQVCQVHDRRKKGQRATLKPITAERPFELVGMDILSCLKPSKEGNRHIIVFTDYYTKWAEAYAIPDMEAHTVAKVLVKNIIARHGAPERMITNRGTQFMSQVFREVTELVQLKHSPSTAYHPQTDGQTERTIGSLISILRKLMEEVDEWDMQLPYALFAYRTVVHETTRETPFFLLYGRDPILPADLFLKVWVEKNRNRESYTQEVADQFRAARRRVREENPEKKSRYEGKNRQRTTRKQEPLKRGRIGMVKQTKTNER